MKRSASYVAVILLTVIAFTGIAPGGPGDAEPIGPGPLVIAHPPSTLSASASSVIIWQHNFGMPCGEYPDDPIATITGGFNGRPTVLAYEQYDRGDGAWDDVFTLSTSGMNLQSGNQILWTLQATEMCEWSTYGSTGWTFVN